MGVTGIFGAPARAARLLLGWSVEETAARSGATATTIGEHENCFMASTWASQQVERAFARAGIVLHEWPSGASRSVTIGWGWISEGRAIEAGRGWLGWHIDQLAKEAGIPLADYRPDAMPPAFFDACETALRRGGCVLLRSKAGKLRGVAGARPPADPGYISFPHVKASPWE